MKFSTLESESTVENILPFSWLLKAIRHEKLGFEKVLNRNSLQVLENVLYIDTIKTIVQSDLTMRSSERISSNEDRTDDKRSLDVGNTMGFLEPNAKYGYTKSTAKYIINS